MRFIRSVRAAAAAFGTLTAAGALSVGMSSAHAMTAKECHANFTAARKAGTLSGQTYKEYKAAQCSGAPEDTTATAPEDKAEEKPAAAAPASATAPAASDASKAKETKTTRAASNYSGNAVFPNAVSSKYSSLSAGKARMKTCLDQYHANKANGGNGGLSWIQRGGGYYSVCNSHLKAG